ncbi:MAG: hypothetical protein QOI16_3378 [Pseudonocardiales bacterium]|nr:hypothetical protein [Pseudonocardiales bacterium]
MTHQEPACPWTEDAVLLALHALAPGQEESVADHVRTCADCQTTMREAQETFAEIGAAAAVAPPPELRHRILAATREEIPPSPIPLAGRRRTAHVARPHVPAAPRPRVRRWAVAAAAAVIVAGMAGGGAVIAQLDRQRDAATVHADPLSDLPATVTAFPHAVLVDRDHHLVGAVVLDDPPRFYALDLPLPAPGREWVVWGAQGQTVAAVGALPANGGVNPEIPAGRPGQYEAYLLSQEATGPLPARPSEVRASGPVTGATGS